MTTVSLAPYGDEDCDVFIGFKRGQLVATAIRQTHGKNVEIIVPEDVYLLSRSFRRGFDTVLPNTLKDHHLTP